MPNPYSICSLKCQHVSSIYSGERKHATFFNKNLNFRPNLWIYSWPGLRYVRVLFTFWGFLVLLYLIKIYQLKQKRKSFIKKPSDDLFYLTTPEYYFIVLLFSHI